MRIPRPEAGFTLIELLVVLFIITTVLSIGMLSFGILGDDRELQTEAKRFGALVEVAQDERACLASLPAQCEQAQRVYAGA